MRKQAEPQAGPGPYTWSDYVALEEDDGRELLEGHLVEIEVPTWTHERIVAALIALLSQWCWEHDAGEVVGSGYRVRIDDQRGTMPDVQFYRQGNAPRGQERGLEHGRPDLAVEVISPTSRSKDSVRKLHDYAAIGVPEFWLVDPEACTVERLVLRDGVYSIVQACEGNETLRPDSFPGLAIELGRLWYSPGS